MRFILQFLLTAGIIYSLARYGGEDFGIRLLGDRPYQTALIFAVILAVVNLLIGTILRVVTFPITLITLGGFLVVIMLIVVYITVQLYPQVQLGDNTPLGTMISYTIIACVPMVTSIFMKILPK